MNPNINTVCAYRSLLQEEDYELKEIAIQQLYNNINLHWTDIANDINTIEELLDDQSFKNKQLVAILLAKIYYFLNDYNEALKYALQSGNYFDIRGIQHSDFVEILINKGIERYIENCRNKSYSEEHEEYKKIVDVAIENSFRKNDLKLPLGIAIDTEDLPLFQKVISKMSSQDMIEVVTPHLFGLDASFKKQVLNVIISYLSLAQGYTPQQYIYILHILYLKEDFETISKIVYDLLKTGQKEIAYTLALEISQMNGFNKKVLAAIPIQSQMENQRKVLENILDRKLLDDVNTIVLKSLAKTDPYYQASLKKIQAKNSISHGSAIMALSFLQAFTQDDSFLQKEENLAWAGKCTHWNKFSSIGSLGLIFKNAKKKDIMKKFLPGNTNADVVNHYPNGGSLYGLGLLFTSTCNQEIIDFLIEITTNPTHNQNDVIMHGACLGLGLTAFASGNETIGERLKDILNSSTSIMGEASALAIGLTYAGTNSDAILSDLIAIAQDTEHEKTLRSICLSIGLISFGHPSLQFLENLESNQNLKLALPLYLACTYFKTSNPVVVRKLLKLSNDISNEVKRTSLIALGFVMYHDDKLVDIVKMLIYSYNPFIRYGCVMALAIGCKESKDAVELVWPLLSDGTDFVRQGVYVALSMLFQIATNNSEPKLEEFRTNIKEILGKTHVEVMAKMGAILSIGILEIGGRNMSISLTTRSGLPKIEAITGLLVFSQYWNWFPYLNFIGLAIAPSAFIGVTADMKIPKSFQLKSNCRPSLFDYPPNIVVEEKKNQNKKEAAKQLSTTNKAKVRAALKKKDSDMDIQSPSNMVKKPSLISHVEEKKQPEKVQQKDKVVVQKKEEQTFSILNNPVRISEKQKKYINFVEGRYIPVLKDRYIGINFLYDKNPGESDDYYLISEKDTQMEVQKPLDQIPEASQEEINPPEDFEYDESKQILKKNQ